MQETLGHRKLELSASATDYCRLTNEIHWQLFNTDFERGLKRGERLIIATCSLFDGVDMTRAITIASLPNFVAVAVVYTVF